MNTTTNKIQPAANNSVAAQPQGEPSPNKAKAKGSIQIPILLETIFSLSRLVVLFTGLATTIISLWAGAVFWMAFLRGAAAMFSIGILLWLVCWQINHDTLEATRLELMASLELARKKEAEDKQKASEGNLGKFLETHI